MTSSEPEFVSESEFAEEIPVVDVQTSDRDFQFNSRDLVGLFFSLLIYDVIGAVIVEMLLTVTHVMSWYWFKSLMTIAIYIFPVGMIMFRALRKINYRGEIFHLKANRIKPQFIPLITIAAISLIVPFLAIVNLIPMPKLYQRMFADMISPDFASMSVACVIAPVLEEVLCRGIILQGLLNKYNPAKAILFSAIFFAVMHLNPWQGIPAFFLGLFAGWLYFKCQSILPGIILHASYNIGSVCFSFLHIVQRNKHLFNGTKELFMVLTCLVIFGLVLMMIRSKSLNLFRLPS